MSQVAIEANTENQSLWSKLVERRVPQILATYFAFSLGFFQIVQWAVKRLGISPHWETITISTLLLLIPTVGILAYNHGRRGEKKLMTVEKMGVPLNLAAVATILFFGFGSKDLGNVTETVSLTDEDGNKIERTVAKEGFKRRVGLFYLKPEGLSEEDKWLSAVGMQTDLSQNSFLAETNLQWKYQFDKAGITDYLNAPIPLLRRIAEEFNYQYFVSGTVSNNNGQKQVRIALHETESAKVILEENYEGSNIFDLIDQSTSGIVNALEIPTQVIEDTKDLPVSELLTDSEEAYQKMVEGFMSSTFENDHSAAYTKSAEAVAIDPTFAYGHIFGFQYADMIGQGDKASEHLSAAATHSYRLSEEDQYVVSSIQALFSQDFERSKSILENLVAIKPGSASGWRLLSQIERLSGNVPGQIEAYEKWFDGAIDNYLQIARLKRDSGDLDGALESAKKYVELNPKDGDGLDTVGNIQRSRKEFRQAEEAYKQALIIDPNHRSSHANLGHLYFKEGDYEKSRTSYQKLIDNGFTEQEKSWGYAGMASLARRHGKYIEASEWVDKQLTAIRSFSNPITITENTISLIETYIDAERTDAVDRIVAEVERNFDNDQVEEFYKFYPAWARMRRAISNDNIVEAEKEMALADQVLSKYSFKSIQDMFLPGRAEVARMKGDFDDAIGYIDEFIVINPNSFVFWRMKAEYQLEKGDLESAYKSISTAVEDDGKSPTYQLVLAKIEKERGNLSESKAALTKALGTWKDADPEYKRLKEALELQAELGL